MNIAAPWLLLMMFDAWRFGVRAKPAPQLPEPYHFIMGSAAMVFCAIIAQANSTLGGVLAWGFLLAAILQHSAATKNTAPPVNAAQNWNPQTGVAPGS